MAGIGGHLTFSSKLYIAIQMHGKFATIAYIRIKEDQIQQRTRTTPHRDIKKWYNYEGIFGDNDHRRHFSKTYLDRNNSTNAQLQIWTRRAVHSTYQYMNRKEKSQKQALITTFVHRDDPHQS